MARIRSIKPEFWVSEQIAECSTIARLTFVGLWNFCDDRGVHPAKPKTLKAELFPMDDITAKQVGEWVGELINVGLVREFTAAEDGDIYWHVTGWDRHQKIDRPSYKHPKPPPFDSTSTRRSSIDETSPSTQRTIVDEDSTSTRRAPPPGVEGSGKEGSEGRSTSARAPSKRKTAMPADFAISERVRAWAAEKGFGNLDQHLDAFRSKCKAKGYTYVDWDEGFMGAVRDDWAKLRAAGAGRSAIHADDVFEGCSN